jgi:hypothetical protein
MPRDLPAAPAGLSFSTGPGLVPGRRSITVKVWREEELTDGWFPGGLDIVPNLTMPLIAMTAVLIVAAIVALARFGAPR